MEKNTTTDQPVKAITFLAGLENYLRKVQETSDEDFKTNYAKIWEMGQAPVYKYTQGKRWVKVTRNDSQTSVFCFIDPNNGDIYKPAGWNAPAKGVRGNIFSDKLPLTCRSLYR